MVNHTDQKSGLQIRRSKWNVEGVATRVSKGLIELATIAVQIPPDEVDRFSTRVYPHIDRVATDRSDCDVAVYACTVGPWSAGGVDGE